MFAKALSSLKDNFIQKTTNPFLGTVIVVWLFHNWKLVFGVFNFDKTWTLERKWKFIGEYLEPSNFIWDLISCIGVAIIVLILTYLLLNFSRLIINFYEKKVTPWVYKITDKSSVVLKSTYSQLEKERDLLEKRLEEERDRRFQVQNELEKLEMKGQSENLNNKTTPITRRGKDSEIIDIIEDNYSLAEFNEVVNRIHKRNIVERTELVDFLLKYDYLERDETIGGNGMFYKFTPIGLQLKQEFLKLKNTID